MEYSELIEVYKKLEATPKKLEKIDILAEFLKKAEGEELPILLRLLEGNIFMPWENLELGVAEKMMINAIQKCTGISQPTLLTMLKETGDLGEVAVKALSQRKQVTLFKKRLTVKEVYENLRNIGLCVGEKSQDRKISIISRLLNFADAEEAKYLVRTLLGDLRVGVAEGILLEAIAKAFNVGRDKVEHAYNFKVDFGEVAKLAKEGEQALLSVKPEIGKPIRVMLAERGESIEKAVEDTKEPAIEIKYDGMRTLVEKKGDKIWLFTRRLENVTAQFPDLVELCRKNLLFVEGIVEGETLGIDVKTGRPLPFQELSKRIHRKYDIEKMAKEIPIQINFFDCILVDGEEVWKKSFKERRRILEEVVDEEEGRFMLAKQIRTRDIKEIEKFYQEALEQGQEGIMIKNLLAPYQPGRRVGYMYKIKPEKETLDVVIVGAEWGEGRRANWLGSFVLAVRDEETGEFLEIGKMGTGLTDEQFKEITERLKPYIIAEHGKEVKLKPVLVIEVGFQELQKSPNYNSGFALRFPKLVRFRDDKSPEEADTLERVKRLYELYSKK